MLTTAESILAALQPWDSVDSIRQRMMRANREGLIQRRSTKGRAAIFSVEDVAVFRALESLGLRADREMLEAISDALYQRCAPDGTAGLGASIRWAAAELKADRGAVLSLARITIGDAIPEWRGFVHPFRIEPEFPDDSRPTAIVRIPLYWVFEPLLPYFDLKAVH